MARVLKIIEGEGAGFEVKEDTDMLDNGEPEVGEPFQFNGEVLRDPDPDADKEAVDGWQFDEIREIVHKGDKIIFKDDDSQAVIEER